MSRTKRILIGIHLSLMNGIDIKDPIHKTIAVSGRERGVLDHQYVQRMRFVRQLGFVPMVYPSATHDRFSHSLGTMHACGILAEQLFCNEPQSALARLLTDAEKEYLIRIARLAGMLHDIGHAPFSHTAERVMPQVRELGLPAELLKFPKEERRATHEDYSALLILGMAEEPDAVLERDEAEIIASLVHHKKMKVPKHWSGYFSKKINAQSLHAITCALISSDLDGDRMDYLLRDSHFAGVPYGQFDLPWLVSNMGVIPLNDRYVMSISESGLHAFEHYLLARYNMYTQVYMHKTSKCFEHYFQRSIAEGELDYRIPAERESYALLRDSTLLERLHETARAKPHSWANRLIRRETAYRVARLWDDEEEIAETFRNLSTELKPYHATPFLALSKSRFLDMHAVELPTKRPSKELSLFTGLATVPIMVVRKQFGISSAVSLADYSFILKRYHQDIVIGDIYILRDEFEANKSKIIRVLKKHAPNSPSEVILAEDNET